MKVRMVSLAAAALLVLAGCAGGSNRLSYGAAQTLNPGVSAAWCLSEYPCGRVTRGPDGKVESIQYGVTDPAGRPQTLILGFDQREVLCTKRYSGRVLRPPQKKQTAPPPCGPVSPCGPPLPGGPRAP